MKLNFSLGKTLTGYTNINVAEQAIDLGNLDSVCGPAECTDIMVQDILRFIGYEQVPLVINHFASRLRHGGKITIIFPDVNSIVRTYNSAEINEEEFNKILFTNGMRSCFSCAYIKKILQSVGLTILKINVTAERVVIISERP